MHPTEKVLGQLYEYYMKLSKPLVLLRHADKKDDRNVPHVCPKTWHYDYLDKTERLRESLRQESQLKGMLTKSSAQMSDTPELTCRPRKTPTEQGDSKKAKRPKTCQSINRKNMAPLDVKPSQSHQEFFLTIPQLGNVNIHDESFTMLYENNDGSFKNAKSYQSDESVQTQKTEDGRIFVPLSDSTAPIFKENKVEEPYCPAGAIESEGSEAESTATVSPMDPYEPDPVALDSTKVFVPLNSPPQTIPPKTYVEFVDPQCRPENQCSVHNTLRYPLNKGSPAYVHSQVVKTFEDKGLYRQDTVEYLITYKDGSPSRVIIEEPRSNKKPVVMVKKPSEASIDSKQERVFDKSLRSSVEKFANTDEHIIPSRFTYDPDNHVISGSVGPYHISKNSYEKLKCVKWTNVKY